MRWFIHLLVCKGKSPPVRTNKGVGVKIDVRLNRLVWVNVNRSHEPAGLIGADGEHGDINFTDFFPYFTETREIPRVAGKIYSSTRGCYYPATPQGRVPVEHGSTGKVLGWNRSYLHRAFFNASPPVTAFNAGNTCIPENFINSKRDDIKRMVAD